MATRVTESSISRTCLPWSRKYSAMAVATSAPRARTRADWSPVATTSTERFSPSAPSELVMKSCTSRPRSPSSAMTLTSACAWRAIMPSSVLLPTPEPAKMPMRWPRPTVSTPSSARTPVAMGSSMGRRSSGLGGSAESGTRTVVPRSPMPSMGWPEPVQGAAQHAGADLHAEGAPEGLHGAAGVDPVHLAQRHEEHATLVEAHDLGEHRRVLGEAAHAAQLALGHVQARPLR